MLGYRQLRDTDKIRVEPVLDVRTEVVGFRGDGLPEVKYTKVVDMIRIYRTKYNADTGEPVGDEVTTYTKAEIKEQLAGLTNVIELQADLSAMLAEFTEPIAISQDEAARR
jgi:hypothetical protein